MPRFLVGEPNTPFPEMAIGNNFLQNNSNSSSNNDQGNFDTNMVIILAALLCALICALGLNTIVRCALRCGHRAAMAQQFGQTNSNPGLKKRALRKIPVEVFGPGTNIPATECPICLGDFADGEKIRVLPNCNHGFHVRCIDTWLVTNPSCPTCRSLIADRPMHEVKTESGSQQLNMAPAHVAVEITDERR